MHRSKKFTYSIPLFILLSVLLHLVAWSGLSGVGDALLLGLDRASHPDVISFLIAGDNPREKQPHPATAMKQPSPVIQATGPDPRDSEPEPPPAENKSQTTPQSQPTPDQATPKPAPDAPPGGGTAAVNNAQPHTAAPAPNGEKPSAAGAGQAAASTGTSPIPDILPFATERLTFSLYWSGIHVGTATLEAVRGEEYSSISSKVRSNAVISAFYKVEDHAETRLANGRPISFRLLQNEGSHHRNRETLFDIGRDKVTYVNHLDKSRQEFEMNGKILWDIISAFYYLRRQPLEIGKSVYISLFDSKKFLNAEVKILRRDTAELDTGEQVPTIVVEPVVTTDGLFQKTGSIVVWLTDDEKRMPVRMETQLKIGHISAKLTSSSVKN